jgi:transcriptional regulator with XRE-family HTH domain
MTELSFSRKNEKALKKEIGQRFTCFRATLGKTQIRLASELKVNQSTIAYIESGKTFPRFSFLYYFFKRYHLDLNWLLLGLGEMFVYEEHRTLEHVSKLPCHIARDDSRYRRYLELIHFMQVPQVEAILLGKLLELKLVAREEIDEFFLNKPAKQPLCDYG